MAIAIHKLIVVSLFLLQGALLSCNSNSTENSTDQPLLTTANIIKEGEISWENKEPCIIQFSYEGSNFEAEACIKCRGGSSSKYYKHSYAIELCKKYSLAGLPNDDDWVLNANYIDKTFMRHKISYDIFKEMSPKNMAAQSAYIRLFINGNYTGLYVLMQEVNAGMLKINKKDRGAMLFKDPPVFYNDDDFIPQNTSNYYQQKFPKIYNDDKSAYIESFRDFLFNSSDSCFAHDISNWVDIRNVIDWHIILLFSNNADGIMKNFYLYKIDKNTPFRFAIWDYDHSFGRDGDNELNMAETELNWQRSILLKRLCEIQETGYTDKLKTRWFQLRNSNIISLENFRNHINNNGVIIGEAVYENFAMWPVDSEWYFDSNTYQQEIDLMLQFVERRLPELDEYISKL